MYLKQILSEAKERATGAAVLRVTAGSVMSSGISEAKKMSGTLLRGSKGLRSTHARAGHMGGTCSYVDRFEYRSEVRSREWQTTLSPC